MEIDLTRLSALVVGQGHVELQDFAVAVPVHVHPDVLELHMHVFLHHEQKLLTQAGQEFVPAVLGPLMGHDDLQTVLGDLGVFFLVRK
jgi:hypothetical protein